MCKNLGQVYHSICASVDLAFKQVTGRTVKVIEIFVTGYNCLSKHTLPREMGVEMNADMDSDLYLYLSMPIY